MEVMSHEYHRNIIKLFLLESIIMSGQITEVHITEVPLHSFELLYVIDYIQLL